MIRLNALQRAYSASVLKKSPNEAPKNTLQKKIIGKFPKLEGLGKCLRPFTDHPCKKEFEAEFHEFIEIRHKLVVFKI